MLPKELQKDYDQFILHHAFLHFHANIHNRVFNLDNSKDANAFSNFVANKMQDFKIKNLDNSYSYPKVNFETKISYLVCRHVLTIIFKLNDSTFQCVYDIDINKNQFQLIFSNF